MLNALDHVKTELCLKPADLIKLIADEGDDLIGTFRAKLSQLGALPLPNGFEISDTAANKLREPFGDYFSNEYETKLNKIYRDLVFVGSALRRFPSVSAAQG